MSGKTIHITRSNELTNNTGQTEGMVRLGAIYDLGNINGNIMIADPHTASAVHHHDDCDTIVYAAEGRGAIVYGEKGEIKKEVNPGDWMYIPAYCVHQEVNDSDDRVVWVICRTGKGPKVCNLEGWSS